MSASEGLLPRVTSLVSVEQPGSREALAADVAGVGEVVGEHVHGQGRHAHVELLADVARLGCLRGELAVGLLVSGQVGAGGKVLSALSTLVLLSPTAGQPRSSVRLVERVHSERLDACQGLD